MKNTLKKGLILFAAMVVMMLPLAVSVFAADSSCPVNASGNRVHLPSKKEVRVCPPSCTQNGYTYEWCTNCDELAEFPYNLTEPTGHNYEVVYEYVDEDGGYFIRKRVCQNPICRKGTSNLVALNGKADTHTFLLDQKDGKAIRYYEIEYVNKFESPDEKAENHKSYFLADYYVKTASRTWVLNVVVDENDPTVVKTNADFYRTVEYDINKRATASNEKSAPEYEYITVANENGSELKLFVSENITELPEYEGKYPLRCKDLTNGGYKFVRWSEPSAPVKGVKTCIAEFEVSKNSSTVSATYYDYNGVMLSEGKINIPYGGTVRFDLSTPERKADQKSHYVYAGWKIEGTDVKKDESGKPVYYGINDEITLYYDTAIVAVYEEVKNKYTVEFVNYYDKTFAAADNAIDKLGSTVSYGDSLENYIVDISSADYAVEGDKQYGFERDARYWIIKAVNGKKLTSEVLVSPYSLKLPESVQVINSETGANEMVALRDGAVITLTPKYNLYALTYRFTVSIKPTHFLDEDVYEDNSIFKADILDKFNIQVTDQYGSYVANGKTDANGNFTFSSPYKDKLIITAVASNRKYYGEQELRLDLCNYEQILKIERDGIIIAPEVTQEWLEGLRGCQCICHSILSPIVIKIYNILYSLFGIKYVCCDDLFIVHGSVLGYVK